jgi:hypothetical protein
MSNTLVGDIKHSRRSQLQRLAIRC